MKIPERTPASLDGLREFIKYVKDNYDIKTVVEIGCWTGISSVEFAKNFDTVYCIDPWSPTDGINTEYDMLEVERMFNHRIGTYENVYKMRHTSRRASELLMDLKADMVYIDGCHEYDAVREDIALWEPKITKLVTGHDYWPKRFDGVIKAVDEILGKPEKIFPDTSWLVRKKT